jgi:hypothetical protein
MSQSSDGTVAAVNKMYRNVSIFEDMNSVPNRFYPDPTAWCGGREATWTVTALPTQHNAEKYKVWPAYKI